MTIADFIIIILLGIGAYLGYKDGFLVTVITFLAFVIGILAAFKLMDSCMKFLGEYIHNNKVLPFISFVLIFILVFVGIIFLGKFLKSSLNQTLFGKFDSTVGAVLGTVKIAFGVSLLLWLIEIIHLEYLVQLFNGSFFYPKLVHFAPKLVSWISHVIPFQDIFQTLKHTLNKK
jgi:membrane protein required for colicin V production